MERALTASEFKEVWDRKPVLRAVYLDYYKRIEHWCRDGRTVELGSGPGNLKEALVDVVASDVSFAPWLDFVGDAQQLPLVGESIANLVGVDVLHHLEYPVEFLAEAIRVLVPGGRVVFVEPAVTPGSWIFFRFAHPEPLDLRADPLTRGPRDPDRDPMDSNQALPTLLARRRTRARLQEHLPRLRLVHTRRLSLIAYPLSGGFRTWSALPGRAVRPVLEVDNHLAPLLGRLVGFRLLMVFEKLP